MHRLVASLLTAAAAVACAGSSTKPMSNAELIGILGVQTWRLPAPDAGREQWTLELVDPQPLDPGGRTVSDVLGRHADTLVSLRPIAGDDYEFSIMQGQGTSSGTLRIAGCKDADREGDDCGSYEIEWETVPRCVAGCKAFVVAAIHPMIGAGVLKQVIVKRVPTPTASPATPAPTAEPEGKV